MKLRLYPAAILYAVNAVVALVVSFGFLTATQAHYVTTIATAVLGLAVAFLARPPAIPVISAGFASLLAGIAGFGVHLTSAQIGAVVTVVSMLAAYFTHQAVTPNSAARKGTTAAEIEARAGRPARSAP
jgi:hypothetical protein